MRASELEEENHALRVSLRAFGRTEASLRADVEQLRRQFATFCLDLMRSPGAEHMPPEVHIPDEVRELLSKHVTCPIGKCDRCGERAPLQAWFLETHDGRLCAWDCREPTNAG